MGSPVSNSSAVSQSSVVSQVNPAKAQAPAEPKKQSAFSKAVSKIADFYRVREGLDILKKNHVPLSAVVVTAVFLGPITALAMVSAVGFAKHLVDKFRTPDPKPAVEGR